MSPLFAAEIHLWPTESGGRKSPLTLGEWRTVLGVNGVHWSARLLFSGSHAPGETFRAQVQLLVPEAAGYFPIGAQFSIWEGGTKGVGCVLSTMTLPLEPDGRRFQAQVQHKLQ
jgi:hypothetical protein